MDQLWESNTLPIISIIANSFTAGSLYTYPIFSASLQSQLKFSVQQVSSTASIGILTQYLCAAFWGSLADKHGPARLSFIAAILFFLGYGPLSYALTKYPSPLDPTSYELDTQPAKILTWIQITFAYSLCGAATTASYFAALTASTKTFGSSRPALSVAGPSTLFGLSPLILSFLGVKFFSGPDEDFDSSGYLGCLALLTSMVNLVGSIGLPSTEISRVDDECNYDTNEQTRLLEPSSPIVQSSPPLFQSSLPLPKPLISSVSKPSPARDLHKSAREFLKTPTVWLLGIVVLLSAGPAEMTISSIGFVVDSNLQNGAKPGMTSKARQVQLISLTNTVSRLLSGWASDRFCGSGSAPRLAIWAAGCLVYSALCFSFVPYVWLVSVLSAISGCFYGMVFTLAPSLVATVWPISSFGRNYGIISYFSATGSFLFTFLFGVLFNPSEPDSLRSIYQLSGLAELISIFVISFLYHRYWAHQLP